MKNLKIKNCLVLLAVVSGLLISCVEDSDLRDGIREVQFKATANTTLINVGEGVTFDDQSLNVATRLWTFEGGSIETATEKETYVEYANDGTFLTTLQVTYTNGKEEKNAFNIVVFPQVEANFTADNTIVAPGGTVNFTDLSSNLASAFEESQELDGLFWEFEGGIPATSTLMNPAVVYPSAGAFSVKLTAHRQAPFYDDELLIEEYIISTNATLLSPLAKQLRFLGSKIELTYAQDIDLPASAIDLFSVAVGGADSNLTSVELDASDSKKIIVSLETPVNEGQVVSLSLQSGIFTTTGGPLAPLNETAIENTVINLYADFNGGFEAGDLGGFPSQWGNYNGTAGRNNPEQYALVNTEVRSGSKSLRIDLDGSNDGFILEGTLADTQLGASYRLSVWAKASAPGVIIDLRAVTPDFSNVPSMDLVLTEEWVQYSFDFIENNPGKEARKYWQQIVASTTEQIYLDDITLYRID